MPRVKGPLATPRPATTARPSEPSNAMNVGAALAARSSQNEAEIGPTLRNGRKAAMAHRAPRCRAASAPPYLRARARGSPPARSTYARSRFRPGRRLVARAPAGPAPSRREPCSATICSTPARPSPPPRCAAPTSACSASRTSGTGELRCRRGQAEAAWYAEPVEPRRINLADPEFEPTDEQLRALSHRAYAEVPRRNAEAATRLAAAIEVRRKAVLARIQPMLASARRSR